MPDGFEPWKCISFISRKTLQEGRLRRLEFIIAVWLALSLIVWILVSRITSYNVCYTKLLRLGSELGANLLDPLKTTNVQNVRAMTTWVLAKVDDRTGEMADTTTALGDTN